MPLFTSGGLGLVIVVLVLVLRIWSCLHHCPNPQDLGYALLRRVKNSSNEYCKVKTSTGVFQSSRWVSECHSITVWSNPAVTNSGSVGCPAIAHSSSQWPCTSAHAVVTLAVSRQAFTDGFTWVRTSKCVKKMPWNNATNWSLISAVSNLDDRLRLQTRIPLWLQHGPHDHHNSW